MNLPKAFIERTSMLLSSEFSEFEKALTSEAPVSIRLNRFKTEHQLSLPQIPWSRDGFYLEKRPNFTFDPLFHAGCYYVQEASSMFLEQAITQHLESAEVVLDLCAAPGGKSTHLRTLLPNDCLLVSNEIVRNRSHILAENLIKWGHPNIVVTQNSPKELGNLTHFFDAVLIDAPCSGEGMFRKDPESINEWSEYNVAQCATRQQNIVDDIWDAIKPGGVIIYSTCTYNLEENERNVAYIVENYDAEVLSIEIDPHWNIKNELEGNHSAYRFFPHKVKGEGFFLAVIRKSENESTQTIKLKKTKQKKAASSFPKELEKWIVESENQNFSIENNKLITTSKLHEYQIDIISEKCNILHKGVTIGELKGRDFNPSHNLAMSLLLNREQFQIFDVDLSTALAYLKTEALQIPDEFAKGFVLLTYQNHPIGWVKNVGNRANNLYPNEWRIRSQHTPDEIKSFW